mgnify:CR=1 FL=1
MRSRSGLSMARVVSLDRLIPIQSEVASHVGDVLAGMAAAKAAGARAAAFSGCGGGPLADAADLCITVPSDSTARIQEMHILIGQMLCAALEIDLGLAEG